jgi:hypothetical protein
MVRERQSRPPSVGVAGWLCVAVGGLMILSAGVLFLCAFLRGILEAEGVDPFAAVEGSLDPLSRTFPCSRSSSERSPS